MSETVLTQPAIRFNFEDFLDSVEEDMPKGIDATYFSLLDVVQHPWKNLRKLPGAVKVLPINTYLLQSWSALIQLYLIPIFFSIPMIILSLYAIVLQGSFGDGVLFILFTMLGVFASPYYMRTMYRTFSDLIESNKAPWLTENITKSFADYYQRKAPKQIVLTSLLLPLVLDAQIIIAVFINYSGRYVILWYLLTAIALVVGHFGTSLVIAVNLVALNFVRVNSKLYDQLLRKITGRVEGYTEGHASLLTHDTYEVVKVLSDTPGLSVQSLGNIPVLGLVTAILIVNAIIFLLGAPAIVLFMNTNALNAYNAVIAAAGDTSAKTLEAAMNASLDTKVSVFTGAFILALLISIILSTSQVLRPIIRISSIMGKFKNKALSELDPFIYDEITNVALEKKKKMDDETQLLFILRQYIYSMKVSPVNPYRLAYFTVLFSIYALRIVPALVRLLSR